jgi:hypothetical protein
MIKEFYAIQKFQKISEALDLNLELFELKIKKSQHDYGGTFHIITKPQKDSGGYTILKSFKDFKELEQFLESFQREINKFATHQINQEQKKEKEKERLKIFGEYKPLYKKRALPSNLKK